MTDERSRPEPKEELEELRARLAEAEETLRAIRTGDVDAVVVSGEHGEQIYTLSGADRIYRQLIETMSEGAVTLSMDGVILYGNASLAAMLGRPLDRVLGTALRSYLSPADQQALDVVLAQACIAPIRREIYLESSDGRRVPVYLSASRLKSEGAKTVFCLVFTDLTDQKSHEQIVAAKSELQSAKAFLDGVINAIADPVFVKDDHRRFVIVNDALCVIVGRSREALLDEDGDDMFPSDQVAVFRRMDADVLDTGAENLNEESLSDLSTGKVRTIITRKSRYLDSAGKRFLVGVIRDISERKRAEQEIKHALREKEALLREIHHRVKNNMQVMSSLFRLQAGHTLNDDARAILKEAQSRIQAMSLVHEKLYKSRHLSRIAFGEYINRLALHLFQFYGVKPDLIRLETELENMDLDIASAMPCGLLVNELISNALKYAFPGNRAGVIRIALKRGTGDLIKVLVADDGIGFPAGLDFSKTKSFGLQIVNLLVGQLGGTMELDRTNGTAFTISFTELKYPLRE